MCFLGPWNWCCICVFCILLWANKWWWWWNVAVLRNTTVRLVGNLIQCIICDTAVPDAVRLPGNIWHGDGAAEKWGRGTRRRPPASEDGRSAADGHVRPWHGGVDDEVAVRRSGHVIHGSDAFFWPWELHGQQRTMAQHRRHLSV